MSDRAADEAAERRNPYLILGVDYGASRAEIGEAYARRARLARADAGYPYHIDDLVWALDQLQGQVLHGPDSGRADALSFRVPADPSVFEPPPGPGLLRPAPVVMRRRTRHAAPAELATLVASARRDATAFALERLAADVERTVVAPAGRIRLSVAEPPRQPRTRVPLLLAFALLAAAAVAAVLLVAGRSDDDAPPTTTSTSVVPETTIPTTTSPPVQGFGTPVDASGLRISPVDPLNAYGLTCALFLLSGTPPLAFDPAAAVLDIGDTSYRDTGIRTGREPDAAEDPATATEATHEVCFQTDELPANTTGLLTYDPGTFGSPSPFRWQVQVTPPPA